MTRWLASKSLGAVRPVDEVGKEALRAFADGDIFWVETKQARNSKHHRLYWAMITLVWDNLETEAFPSVEDFHEAVKVMVGLRKRIWIPPGIDLGEGVIVPAGGLYVYRPGSISFARMDQAKFNAFFDKVADLLTKWFLPTVTATQLKKEVESMIAPSSYTSARAKKARNA